MLTKSNKLLIDRLNKIDNIEKTLTTLLDENNRKIIELKKVENSIKQIISERTLGFPWVANAISDYLELCELKVANYLKSKKRPAFSTAEKLKEISQEKKILKKSFYIARNRVKFYESLFPWITEYIGEDMDLLLKYIADESIKEIEIDPVLNFVPKGEYLSLSETVRNQKALDRYLNSRKHPWQIGRDYERYIGYIKEMQGYKVNYQGIELGLEDLGRDLVCKKQGKVEIIQCKCWAKHKTIHEKHINQLFGTATKYYIDKNEVKQNNQLTLFQEMINNGSIKAVFYTSTSFSDTAKKFASALGIEVFENYLLREYPIIKCNISKNTKEKIYHLPFDQKYDDAIIELNSEEKYVKTVKEAEDLGFRRAWKWQGENSVK